jgi:hypothetical protein
MKKIIKLVIIGLLTEVIYILSVLFVVGGIDISTNDMMQYRLSIVFFALFIPTCVVGISSIYLKD